MAVAQSWVAGADRCEKLDTPNLVLFAVSLMGALERTVPCEEQADTMANLFFAAETVGNGLVSG